MPILVPMVPRDTEEQHRAATPLELFFDLTFVVAVAQASESLHHGLVDGHAARAIVSFPLVFFAIWWAWMNFTWFASAYDNDDVAYRIAVFVQMTGVLILAAGVPRAFADVNFGIITLGYVVMRLAMVGLWVRAGVQHPEGRTCAFRYAIGIAVLQVGWVLRLALPDAAAFAAFFMLAALELSVPLWAERAGRTPWHPRHIAERYGLFTIIVLGESVLSATTGVQTAIDLNTPFSELGFVVVGGLLTLFAMWWIYFDLPNERLAEQVRREFAAHMAGAFTWGYGHYLVFASAAAVGAGLVVEVDHVTKHSDLTALESALAFTVPVCLFLLSVWAVHYRYKRATWVRSWAVPTSVALILASSLTREPVLATGVIISVLVAANVVTQLSAPADAA
ncbi:MAG TPA: low temperature requirement protein A [Acidimicrobiales bacterium]|nr:low temperature requirement protein A [Acidimicrobiales bacterium]